MSRNFELLRKVQGSDPLDTFRVAGESWPEDSRRRLPPREPGYQPIHEPEWLRAATVLKKHWRPALLFGLGIFALVAVITFLTKPVYEPIARLEVDPPGTEAFSMQGYNVPGNADRVRHDTGEEPYRATSWLSPYCERSILIATRILRARTHKQIGMYRMFNGRRVRK